MNAAVLYPLSELTDRAARKRAEIQRRIRELVSRNTARLWFREVITISADAAKRAGVGEGVEPEEERWELFV